MDEPRFERVTIIGLGLIGGSLALAARASGRFGVVTGVGRGVANLEEGLARGIVDRTSHDPVAAVAGADLVVLAVPVGSLAALAEAIAPALSPDAIVTDVGSVKRVCRPLVRTLGSRFVPGHPIAGTERSGAAHAFAELFRGRRCILTPADDTDPAAIDAVRDLWESVGMNVLCMDAETHDHVLALVSHLPHVVAYALMEVVGESERRGEECLSLSAGGLYDFTRIAASDPEMWRDICLENAPALRARLAELARTLERVERALAAGDGTALVELFARARAVRERLAVQPRGRQAG